MNIHEKANQLTMSPTLNKLASLAGGMPLDVENPEDLHSVLSTCLLDLVEALDNDRISFTHDEDKAMLHGLLCVVMVQVFGKERIQENSVVVH
jgi:hypothetical protein